MSEFQFPTVTGKAWGEPLSPELEQFIDGLDCPGKSKTRLKNGCKNEGVTEISELRDHLDRMTLVPNLGRKSIGYVRRAFGLNLPFNEALAKRLSYGG